MENEMEREKPGALLSGGADPAAKSAAAALLGKTTSERKTAAVRENGKLGGKKKGATDTDETRQRKAESARAAWAARKQKAGNQ